MELTRAEIRELCTESSFQRALNYCAEGRVKELKTNDFQLKAKVLGSQMYKVEVDLETVTANCSCPYDYSGYCKHIIAALLSVNEGGSDVLERLKTEEKDNEEDVEDLLARVEWEELKEFLEEELERSAELRSRFLIYFGDSVSENSLYDYKQEIDLLYEDAADNRGFIDYYSEVDFSSVAERAELCLRKDRFLEAAKVYRALFECIAENMNRVDDSSGYYGMEFEIYLKDYVVALNKAELTFEQKGEYIDYLFAKFIERDPDYFNEYYEAALLDLLESEEELEYCLDLLTPYLPKEMPDSDESWSEHYWAQNLVKVQLELLDRLGSDEEREQILAKYYQDDIDFCLLYAERLKEIGKLEKAVEVAEDMLADSSSTYIIRLRSFLSEIYRETDSAKYKYNLLILFCETLDFEYYQELKELATAEEWARYFEELEDNLAKRRDSALVNVYLREELWDRALEVLQEENSLHWWSKYYDQLADKFVEEYFAAYTQVLPRLIESKTGRKHYQQLMPYLRELKTLMIFDGRIESFLRDLRNEFANRPAFLDELQKNLG